MNKSLVQLSLETNFPMIELTGFGFYPTPSLCNSSSRFSFKFINLQHLWTLGCTKINEIHSPLCDFKNQIVSGLFSLNFLQYNYSTTNEKYTLNKLFISLKICNHAKKSSNNNCFQTHLVVIVMVFQSYFLVYLTFLFFLVEQLYHKYTQHTALDLAAAGTDMSLMLMRDDREKIPFTVLFSCGLSILLTLIRPSRSSYRAATTTLCLQLARSGGTIIVRTQ